MSSAPAAKPLTAHSAEELAALESALSAEYDTVAASGLQLDLTRGKPSAEQLDLAERLLALPEPGDHTIGGVDVRNYGGGKGLTELRSLMAELLACPVEQVVAADNSSLSIMYDMLSFAMNFGTTESPRPWTQEPERKWICLTPGYDRHFAITEAFGFEMISVEIGPDGPDLDEIERLAADPAVKGMWVVPIFSNPTGVTLSDHAVQRLALMRTGAPDFRIIWDNAYMVHTLGEDFPKVSNVVQLAGNAGFPNRFWQVCSTSKISFAGAGVAFVSSSTSELDWYLSHAGIRAIGPNKVNQLAHLRFFESADGLRDHMQRHRAILAPKFKACLTALSDKLSGYDVASWTYPEGGYFIDLSVVDGTAADVVALTKAAGVALTPAGAAYPYGTDPHDRHIRLAPSMPPLAEVEQAMQIVALCTLLAAVRHQRRNA